MKDNKEDTNFECKSNSKIDKVYIVNVSDCVFENGVIVRMKRRYGKFNRKVYVLTNNNNEKI